MNARMEIAMDSENLGARITENGALDQNIWALEVIRGKIVILGGSLGISRILVWLEGLGPKDRGSCKIWKFFKGFNGILEGLGGGGLGPIHKYF
jgi:hypothetical protein